MIEVSSLEKTYGSHKILKAVSLKIEPGQFVSLLGPSGSGKTTILRCLAGLEEPDPSSGEIRIHGKKLSGGGEFAPPERRNFGMVFQNYAVWPHLDVFENVAFPLRLKREGGAALERTAERVKEVLELVKLSNLERRYPHELSGGQQQRVALARALVMSPDALLLDEPLSNLDALLREELGAEIRALQQRLGLTTLLVTHDRKEALSLSDRVVVLNRGSVEADGTPEALYSNPPTEFVARFLSGAQVLPETAGKSRVFLPRRWELASRDASVGKFVILSRLFLGNEYEYWAKGGAWAEPIRFFAPERFEAGAEIGLRYRDLERG
jgi:iron(III) transport system ATP-binding protein